jgi:nucleotide-binding universal stress UspA family protein
MRRLLFPTDYSACAERAFAHAAFLADSLGAELHVLHVAPIGSGRPPASLRRFAAPRVIEIEERADAVPDAIVGYAADHAVSLVVMGTHGRRGPEHLALGSVAERVVRLAPCPVLTVGPAAHPAAGAVRRLLVPVDFSEHATRALAHAALLAEAYGARVDVLHALDVATLPPTLDVGLVWTDPAEDRVERTREGLAAIAGRHLPPERRGDVLVEVGDPAQAIRAAARDSDLVVMGTHGRTGFRRLVLGSVAERVVRRAPCPVLIVRRSAMPLVPEMSGPAASASP